MALDQDLFLISMAAEMLGMHPQTLRKYERLGLIQPSRTSAACVSIRVKSSSGSALIKHLVDESASTSRACSGCFRSPKSMQRIQPLMDETALSTGAGRRQLLSEMRRLNDMIGI